MVVAPTIAVEADHVITGSGFLPDHDVTVRVDYTAEDVSDYLAFGADSGGCLHAELPTSPALGALTITATDHRPNPNGLAGLLWSNSATVQSR